MFRRKQPNRLKIFYYSHPYFVIFNILIVYNIILIAIAALVMTYLMRELMPFNGESYLKNLEYCVVFTMNNGGIYNDAPVSVIVMKIILSILQMITFTGALIGLATSILQSMFDKRIHNLGKIKIKHHYVILEWSAVGPQLIRELSFIRGNKTVVILSSRDRNEIQEEIDDLFLETGTDKKHLKIFVKNGSPSSRKALKEINIDKAESIAILGASSWLNASEQNDSISFKILMSVISLTNNSNIVIETDDQEVTKNIHDLMEASSELKEARISIFSRNTIVGHVLAKTAINADYPNLYYSLLSFRNGSFYAIDKPFSVEEALNISGVIIANQMVAVYMTQLLCHAESHKLYEDLLMPDSNSSLTFEIRQGKELFDLKDDHLEFNSRGDFISALYLSSNKEYLPIGFIGEKKKLGLTDAVTSVVSGAINATGKVLNTITNVLTLSDTPEDVTVDFTDVMFINSNINKKEKIVIRPDTTMIVVHQK